MTNLKKLGTYLMLCQLLRGLLRRYESDLNAEANVSLAVDKLSQEFKIKWKDNTKASKLERPSLVDSVCG